jgi:hypothetical protein
MTFVLTLRDVIGLAALSALALVMLGWLSMLGWARLTTFVRERAARRRAFAEIGDALERDIAAAEARGIHVDRGERLAPSRKRIKF